MNIMPLWKALISFKPLHHPELIYMWKCYEKYSERLLSSIPPLSNEDQILELNFQAFFVLQYIIHQLHWRIAQNRGRNNQKTSANNSSNNSKKAITQTQQFCDFVFMPNVAFGILKQMILLDAQTYGYCVQQNRTPMSLWINIHIETLIRGFGSRNFNQSLRKSVLIKHVIL